MGLLFPFILIFNLLFVPFWLIFKARYVLVPILGMLLCSGFIMDYFPLHLGDSKMEEDLKVVTWNVKSFGSKDYSGSIDEIQAYIDSLNADILCFQEFYGNANCNTVHNHMDSLGYFHAQKDGRRIYSRYPIVDTDDVTAGSAKSNGMFIAKLFVNGDTLLVVNMHLECNFISQEDRAGGKEALKSGERAKMEKEGRHLWDKLALSAGYRSEQIDSVTQALDTHYKDCSVLVCGDYNDTPISYSYQQLASRMENAYRNKGTGLGVSYNERFFWIRIDHLFHSKDWETASAFIDRSVDISDHYPLIVGLKKQQK